MIRKIYYGHINNDAEIVNDCTEILNFWKNQKSFKRQEQLEVSKNCKHLQKDLLRKTGWE